MERRKSFRYPASPERQPAHLQLSGNDCAAILLDESVGGFRVAIGRDDVESAQEEEALLQTYSGWHDVQIVRRIAEGEIAVVEVQPIAAACGEARDRAGASADRIAESSEPRALASADCAASTFDSMRATT